MKRSKIDEKIENKEPLAACENLDVFELLQHIENQTFHSITVDDFYPMNLLTAFEPFLNMMGFGWYSMRPSPFCGYMTCLVNTERSFISYPVTRLFNFDKLHSEMKPLLPRLQDGKIGIYNATKLKKVFYILYLMSL